jgi:hypothetical protein
LLAIWMTPVALMVRMPLSLSLTVSSPTCTGQQQTIGLGCKLASNAF